MTGDELPTAPAAGRNREPLLAVLRTCLPERGLVLEVASGTGEHAVWFSAALPGVRWQPSERDSAGVAVIAARRDAEGGPGLLAPVLLDASVPEGWPLARADAVVAVNMIHIAPWAATLGLMAGAGRVLSAGGVLVLYGPFREGGVHTGPGNVAFDASLRERDAAWGIRDIEGVADVAASCGLRLEHVMPMPANNRVVLFRREA